MYNDSYTIEHFMIARQKLLDISPYLRMKQKLQKNGWVHLVGDLWTKDPFIKSFRDRNYHFKEYENE